MANYLKTRLEKVFQTGDLKLLEQLMGDGLMEIDIYKTVCDQINTWSMKRNQGMDTFQGGYEYSEEVLIKLVDTLIANGFDVNHPIDDSEDHPNLFWGIMNFQTYPKLLEYLIEKGSELNYRHYYGTILDNYLGNVDLDSIAGYGDLARCTNEGCKLAIYHGAVPVHLMERHNPNYKGRVEPETFVVVDAILSRDYESLLSKDANYLERWDVLGELLRFSKYRSLHEVFSPSKEFQDEILRISLRIMEKTGYCLQYWHAMECFSQNLEHVIIGLIETGEKELLKDLANGIEKYGELMEPESLARIKTIYNIITAADGVQLY